MAQGDEEFDRLYEAERDGLFRLAVLVCGDRARAEDAVAEAFARVLPRWRRGGIERPADYLRRSVLNELTGRHRRRVVERRHADRRDGLGRPLTWGPAGWPAWTRSPSWTGWPTTSGRRS